MSDPDPYIRFTRQFFRGWLPLYDWFALPIFYVYNKAVRLLAPTAGERVLDVCTGTGQISLRCARRGASVTAIDITDEMLDKARQKSRGLPIDFQLLDARALPFADNEFDKSILSFALHDMPRRVRAQVAGETIRVAKTTVIVDYHFPRGKWAHAVTLWLIKLYESPYLPDFSRGGVPAVLAELGVTDYTQISAGPGFAIFVISG